MRVINVEEISKNIKEMCIEANYYLSDDMKNALYKAAEQEENPLGCQILNQLKENLDIAGVEQIPICQDTGMAVVFAEVGQDVHIEGGSLTDAINKGVHDGYVEGYLRKSVVNDPFIRENTKDNTPAVIHYSIVPGENIKLTVAPKGFGSENMSRVFMLKPADGMEGAVNAYGKQDQMPVLQLLSVLVLAVHLKRLLLWQSRHLQDLWVLIPSFLLLKQWKKRFLKR